MNAIASGGIKDAIYCESSLPQFVCPSCHTPVTTTHNGWECPEEGVHFAREGGIPSFILPHRREALERFLKGYQQIRSAEKWGSFETEYYRDLPYRDRTRKHAGVWRIRAHTFDCLLDHLLRNVPAAHTRILDVGAGNCWLASRLSQDGFETVVLDINLDPLDGLGVIPRIPVQDRSKILAVRAEFDALPFAPETFDVVVFNASLHYSSDVLHTLQRTLRIVKDGGLLYICDSPIYKSTESGNLMLRERNEEFRRLFNVTITDDFPGGFLTFDMFNQFHPAYRVEFLSPRYGLVWTLRPILAAVLGRREPATFQIIALHKPEGKR